MNGQLAAHIKIVLNRAQVPPFDHLITDKEWKSDVDYILNGLKDLKCPNLSEVKIQLAGYATTTKRPPKK